MLLTVRVLELVVYESSDEEREQSRAKWEWEREFRDVPSAQGVIEETGEKHLGLIQV